MEYACDEQQHGERQHACDDDLVGQSFFWQGLQGCAAGRRRLEASRQCAVHAVAMCMRCACLYVRYEQDVTVKAARCWIDRAISADIYDWTTFYLFVFLLLYSERNVAVEMFQVLQTTTNTNKQPQTTNNNNKQQTPNNKRQTRTTRGWRREDLHAPARYGHTTTCG